MCTLFFIYYIYYIARARFFFAWIYLRIPQGVGYIFSSGVYACVLYVWIALSLFIHLYISAFACLINTISVSLFLWTHTHIIYMHTTCMRIVHVKMDMCTSMFRNIYPHSEFMYMLYCTLHTSRKKKRETIKQQEQQQVQIGIVVGAIYI